MPQINLAENIRGDKMSKLAVGKYTIELSNINGAVIDKGITPEVVLIDSPSTRNLAITQLQGEDELLDLENTVGRIVEIFQSSQSVELRSAPGFERLALLRYLASNSQINSLSPHKAIYIRSAHAEVEDILQSIWEAFYQSDFPYKPTSEQVQQEIADKQILVVLDENKLIQDEFKELFKTAKSCKFLFTSSQRKILDSKNVIELTGWEEKHIKNFLENKLQYSLKTQELEVVTTLRDRLKGNPTYIKLALVYIVENGFTLNQLISQLPNKSPEKYILQQILESLTHKQRQIVDLLAVMGNVGLESNQVISITKSSEDSDILEDLRRRYLLNFDGSHYTLTLVAREFLSPPSKLLEPLASALTYFKKTGQKYQSKPYALCPEIDAIVHLLEVAITANRWQDVVCLGMSVESSLALNRLWGLWKQVLQRILQASQASQEKAIQAWAYHQLGTRHLCLNDDRTANDYLNKALELRVYLDDQTAIVATGHHLDLLQLKVDSPLTKTNLISDTISPTDTTLLHSPEELDKNNMQIISDTHLANGNLEINNDNDKELPTRIYRKKKFKLLKNLSSKKASSSSKKIIAAGVFLSGGLVGVLGWDRLTHIPENSSSDNSQPASQTASPIPESIPTPIPASSSVTEPEPIYPISIPKPAFPSSLIEKPPAPEPPLVPSAEHQHPNQRNIYNFNPMPKLPNTGKNSKPQTELDSESGLTNLEPPSPPLPPLSPNIDFSPTLKKSPKVRTTPKAIDSQTLNSTSTPGSTSTSNPASTSNPESTSNPASTSNPESTSNPASVSTPDSASTPTLTPNPTPVPKPTSTPLSSTSPKVKTSPSKQNKSLQKSGSNQMVPEPIPVPRFTPISVE